MCVLRGKLTKNCAIESFQSWKLLLILCWRKGYPLFSQIIRPESTHNMHFHSLFGTGMNWQTQPTILAVSASWQNLYQLCTKNKGWATSKHWGFKKHNPQTLKTPWNFQDVKVLLKLLMYQSTFWSSETWQFNLGNMWENWNFNLNIARLYCNFPQVYSFEEHAYFPPDSWLLKIAVSFLKGVINSTVVISASKSTTKFNRQWGKLLLMDASHILNKAHSYALLSVWFFSFLTWFLLCSWSASSYKALTKAIQGLLVTASD